MTILGIGSDIIDIRRIEQTIGRFGDRFLDRVFTPVERARCDARLRRAESYARRYAAKEAAAKALGTGFRHGVFWRDLGVVNKPGGQPTLAMTGGAAARLARLLPERHEPLIHLTMTDEPPFAEAVVIISALRRD